MIAEPPFDPAVNGTLAVPDAEEVTSPIVGALGVVAGVTEAEGAEFVEVPTPLLAVAVNVYAVPFVKPVTVHEVLGALAVQVLPSGDEVMV